MRNKYLYSYSLMGKTNKTYLIHMQERKLLSLIILMLSGVSFWFYYGLKPLLKRQNIETLNLSNWWVIYLKYFFILLKESFFNHSLMKYGDSVFFASSDHIYF